MCCYSPPVHETELRPAVADWWLAADLPGEGRRPPAGYALTVFYFYDTVDEASAAWIADNIVDEHGEAELISALDTDPRELSRWLVLRGTVLYEFAVYAV